MTYTYSLAYGDVGADVRGLQEYLVTKGTQLSPDGHFGPNTRTTLVGWQHGRGLNQTGLVDGITREALEADGLVLRTPPSASAQSGTNWSKTPTSPPQPNPKRTESLFGRFDFVHSPTPGNPERIEILHDWIEDNIIAIDIPELNNSLFAVSNTYVVRAVGQIRCHKLAAPKFQQLFRSGGRPA